jgi:hypothetical protein
MLQLEKIFDPKIGITLQLSPIFVADDQSYLFDWQSCLEQTACSLGTQIVEVQVFDLEFITCAGECRTYRSMVRGKIRP